MIRRKYRNFGGAPSKIEVHKADGNHVMIQYHLNGFRKKKGIWIMYLAFWILHLLKEIEWTKMSLERKSWSKTSCLSYSGMGKKYYYGIYTYTLLKQLFHNRKNFYSRIIFLEFFFYYVMVIPKYIYTFGTTIP